MSVVSIESRLKRPPTNILPPPLPTRRRWSTAQRASFAAIVVGVIILAAAHAIRPYAFIHYCPSPLKVQRVGPTTTQVTCEAKP